MKQTLFNDEVEGYANLSNVKFYIFGTVVFAGAVFVGYLLNILPKVVLFMDVFTESV
jgi:hypothetical protein